MSKFNKKKKSLSPEIENFQYDLNENEELFSLNEHVEYEEIEDDYHLTLEELLSKDNNRVIEYYEELLSILNDSIAEYNKYEKNGFEIFYESERSSAINFIRGATLTTSSNRTLYGFNDLEMRNLLFKNVRLGLSQEAMFDMVDIYTLALLPVKNAINVLTTNMNQLLANVCRYAGPTALAQIITVATIYNANVKQSKLPLSYVLSMVDLLSQSNKNPIISYTWFAYVTPLGRKQAQSKAPHLLHNTGSFNDEEIKNVDWFYEGENFGISQLQILRKEDYFINNNNAIDYLIAFASNVNKEDNRAYSWLHYYLVTIGFFSTKKKVEKDNPMKLHYKVHYNDKESTNNLDILLWLIIENFLPDIVYIPLVTLYYNSKTKDRVYFLALAVFCALNRKLINLSLKSSANFLENDIPIQASNLQYYLYQNHEIDSNMRISIAQVAPFFDIGSDPMLEAIYLE